jgi:UDP-glucose 4-epimerase
MKVIIFGGKGFIGSSLIKYFNNDVVLSVTDIRTLTLDLLINVDILINCAGSSNVAKSFIEPKNDYEKNANLVFNLLEVIRASGNKKIKFINLSSAAVYGNPLDLPIIETDKCLPISPYGSHKLISEEFCRYYHKCFGIKTLSLRIFSAYGNGQKKLLLWDLHEKIERTKGKIILFGTGKESRDFIHVDDISEQILLAINNAAFQGEAINVANGLEVRVSKIVELYEKFYPKKFDYDFNGEIRIGDPMNWCADITLMQNWGYSPKIDIHQGIENYINWASNE